MCDNCACGAGQATNRVSEPEGGPATIEITAPPAAGDVTTTYTVAGMTCGHCASAVSTEVGRIAGVTGVTVDLASGAVTVASDLPLDAQAVRAAVDEAGYELVGS